MKKYWFIVEHTEPASWRGFPAQATTNNCKGKGKGKGSEGEGKKSNLKQVVYTGCLFSWPPIKSSKHKQVYLGKVRCA